MEREPETTSKGVNPAKAFAIVVAVLVVVGVTWYLAGSKADPPPTTEVEQPDFSLTDEEAIARAEQLERLVLRAYVEQDLSLLPHIYSPESTLLAKTRNEIRYLKRKGITTRPHFKLLDMEVVRNDPTEIVLIERSEFDAHFVDEGGEDVTGGGRLELHTTRLTLHLERDEWLIFDSVITDAEPLR